MKSAAEKYEIAHKQLQAQRDLYDRKTTDLTKHLANIVGIQTKLQRLNSEKLKLVCVTT